MLLMWNAVRKHILQLQESVKLQEERCLMIMFDPSCHDPTAAKD